MRSLLCQHAAKNVETRTRSAARPADKAERQRGGRSMAWSRGAKAAFKQIFSTPADVPEYCATLKSQGLWEEVREVREKHQEGLGQVADLKDPRVLPAGAVGARGGSVTGAGGGRKVILWDCVVRVFTRSRSCTIL